MPDRRPVSPFLQRTAAAAAALAALAFAPAASSNGSTWASAAISRVTSVGVLGDSSAGFRPQAPLTERALAAAIAATDALLQPPAVSAPPAAAPAPAPAPAPTPT